MEKINIEKFNENVKKEENGKIISFEDKKGNYYIVALKNMNYTGIERLLCTVAYTDLTKQEFTTLKFKGADLEEFDNYNKIKKFVPVPVKSGKETRIVETDKEAVEFWLVKNGAGIEQVFKSKEDALKFAKNVNEKVLSLID